MLVFVLRAGLTNIVSTHQLTETSDASAFKARDARGRSRAGFFRTRRVSQFNHHVTFTLKICYSESTKKMFEEATGTESAKEENL